MSKLKNFLKSIFCKDRSRKSSDQSDAPEIKSTESISNESCTNSSDVALQPLTVSQYSKLHNIPRSTVSRWVKSGKIAINGENLIIDIRIPVKEEKTRKYVFLDI